MDRKIKKKKFTLKRVLTWGGASVFVLLILYSFIFAEGGSKLNVEKEKVNIANVVEGDFRQFIPVDGNVMPILTIRLDAIVGGVVEEKYYDGGILVDKGDTILKLSNNDLLQNFVREETQAFILVNNVENTKLNLQRNQFELKRSLLDLDYQIDAAEDAYERGKPLYDEKISSQKNYLQQCRSISIGCFVAQIRTRLKAHFSFAIIPSKLEIERMNEESNFVLTLEVLTVRKFMAISIGPS